MEEDTIKQVLADSTGLSADSITLSADSLTFEPTWNALRASIDTTSYNGSESSLCDSIIPLRNYMHELFMYGQPLHYSFLRSIWTMSAILVCFILLVGLFAWYRKHLKKYISNFFLPSNNRQPESSVKTPAESYAPFFLVVVGCVLCGLLLFFFVGQTFDLELGFLPHSLVLVACIAVFVLYNLVRCLLYSFVNWIFFQPSERKRWTSGFSLLSTIESLLLLPISIVVLHFQWTFAEMQIMLLVTYGLLRFLLLYHSCRIFLNKMYGILHLFAYLCTLELVPLVSLWVFMEVLSNLLIVK